MRSNRVLVAYGTKHGSTAEIAGWIGEALADHGLDVEIRDADGVDSLAPYGALVLGGALYMGRWCTSARRLARQARRVTDVTETPVWLFSSGPLDDSAVRGDAPVAPGVRRIMRRLGARGHATFGGKLDADASGAMTQAVAKKSHGDFRDRQQVEAWAGTIAAELIALGFHRRPLVDGGRA